MIRILTRKRARRPVHEGHWLVSTTRLCLVSQEGLFSLRRLCLWVVFCKLAYFTSLHNNITHPHTHLLVQWPQLTFYSFGYDTGQISGFLEMPDFLDRFAQTNSNGEKAFSTVRSGLIVALLSIGTLIGALVAAPVSDRIGRKFSISGWTWIIAIGFVIQISSNTDWVQIMMGRFVAGLGVGALSLLVPMFQVR